MSATPITMNSHDAARVARDAGLPGVYVGYEPQGTYGYGYAVRRPGFQTDPNMIHNGGNKLFSGPRNSHALQEAIQWAGHRFGIEEWVKIPGFGGDYFPESAAKVIIAERKRRIAAAKAAEAAKAAQA